MIPEHTDAALASLDPDLVARLRFVLEADALKSVLRRNSITDGSRRENTGEHSWYLALMALVLAPYSNEPVDIGRVIEMLLVHDIVEIDAGDTFVYDDEAREHKEALEQRAADRLFAMVPGYDALELRRRWDEFEERSTRRRASRTPSIASHRCS
jgi:putative hydrolase of HD superfamily